MLTWIENRWHLDGKPIHAGNGMEIRWPDGTWERGRVESGSGGRKLFFLFDHRGEAVSVLVCDLDRDQIQQTIRWPQADDYYDKMRMREAAAFKTPEQVASLLRAKDEFQDKANETLRWISDAVKRAGLAHPDTEDAETLVKCLNALEQGYLDLQSAQKRLTAIHNLCGCVQDGSDQTVKVFQDDATREWFIATESRRWHGSTLNAAIDAAIADTPTMV